MVNFLVWSVLVVSPSLSALATDESPSESRFVEVIIHDLEKSQFLQKIKDKVILFPNQLKAQLAEKSPLFTPVENTPDRVRRATPQRSWTSNTIQQKRAKARKYRRQQYLNKKEIQRRLALQAKTTDDEHSSSGYANQYQLKQQLTPEKRFGGWTSWNGWTSCSVTCGDGYRSRRRFCANASLGSDSCPGLATEHVPCGAQACYQYEWSGFQYTECTRTCGSGETYANRMCLIKGSNRQVEDRHCNGKSFATHPCNTQQCQQEAEYEWSNYKFTQCSRSCSGGDQYGTRQCLIKGTARQVDDKFCTGSTFYRRECNKHSCDSAGTQIKVASGPKCGFKPKEIKESEGPKQVQLRITGGQIAEDGDWPWQVSLQHRSCKKSSRFGSDCSWKHMCGASIVDKKWVVTAAHCIEESGYYTDNQNPGDDWAVVIGMDKLNYNHDGINNGRDGSRYLLKQIIPHPDYVFTYITHSDVALLQLREEIEYSDEVQPICLPSGREPKHGQHCHITGWGYTHGKGEVLSHHLRHASIPMVNFSQCRKTGIWYKLLKEDVHMCGGDVNRGGIDSCGGDSGGPLTCQDPDTKMYYLAGVTSFGFSDCGKRGHLGIYARMHTFEAWIRKTIDTDVEDVDHEPFYGGYQYYSQYKSLGSIKMYG